MADFDSEQMRILLQNLADKLNNTKGDDNIVEKLKAVQKAIEALDRRAAADEKKSKTDQKKENADFLKDLAKELDNLSVLKNIEKAIHETGVNNAGPGQDMLKGLSKGNIGSFSKSIGSATMAFGKFSAAVGGGALKLANQFGHLDGSFMGLAKAIGQDGAAFGVIAGILDENVNAYRTLVNSAEGTIGSIQDMHKATSEASLSAQQFADAVAKGTQGTKLLGAMPWATVFHSLKEQTKSMGYYAMNTDQLIKAQGEYLDMLANRNDLFNRDSKDIAAGLTNLLKTNDRMAMIMGKTREEQLAAAAEAARDPNFQMYMRDDKTNVDKDLVNEVIGTLNGISPALANIGKDQLMMNGGMTGEAAKVYAVLPAETQTQLTTLLDGLRNNTISSEDAAKAIQALKPSMDKYAKENGQTMAILGSQVGGQFQTLNEIGMETAKLKQGTYTDVDGNKKEFKPGTEQDDPGTRALLKFEQTAMDLASGVRDGVNAVMDPLLNNYGPQLEGLVDYSGKLINGFRDTIKSLSDFDTAITVLTTILAGGAIVNAVSSTVTTILAARMVPQIGSLIGKIISPIASLSKGMWNLSKAVAGSKMAKYIASAIGGAFKKLPGLLSGLMGGAGGMGKMAGAVGKAGAYGAAAVASYEAGSAAGEGLGSWLVNNHPEAAAWLSENVFGNKVDPEAVKKARQIVDKGGSVTDYAENAKSDQEAKQAELDAAKEDTPEPAEPAPAEPKSDPQLDDFTATIKEHSAAMANGQVTPEMVGAITAQADAQTAQTAQMTAAQQALADSVTLVKGTSLNRIDDSSLQSEAFLQAFNARNTELQNIVNATNSALDRIYQILKQNLDFDKENGQALRDRLAELSKLQEDNLRLTRRS